MIKRAPKGTPMGGQFAEDRRPDGGELVIGKVTLRYTASGLLEWRVDGKLHRTDGPAIEYPNGAKAWYQNGELHRVDGPAIEQSNGDCAWYRNGKLHRLNGPAIEYTDGRKEWWVKGRFVRSQSLRPTAGAGRLFWG